MKKIGVSFLLGVFLFNTAGYFIAFKSAQNQIKKEIKSELKNNLPTSELTAIVVDKKQLNKIEWLENGKEIKYKDEFYDVVRSSENNTSITYYCINDKQEKLLFTHLEEHINTHITGNDPIKKQNQKKLSDKVIKLYFLNESSIKFNIISFNRHNFFSSDLIYKSTFIETDFPPPEFV